MHGVIPAQGEAKIEVIFEPKTSQSFNYNINCNVMRRNRPICINVKGIGYVLSHSVFLSGKPNPIERNEKCEVSFGSIFVNEVKDKKIIIENNGDFNFDFAMKTSHSFPFLKISNEFGTVKKNEKFAIDLVFAPQD
jgi:hydrocephalus-inducing protein